MEARNVDVELGLIVRDRYVTIRSQLKHWLDFIGKDSKLKELEKTDHVDDTVGPMSVYQRVYR